MDFIVKLKSLVQHFIKNFCFCKIKKDTKFNTKFVRQQKIIIWKHVRTVRRTTIHKTETISISSQKDRKNAKICDKIFFSLIKLLRIEVVYRMENINRLFIHVYVDKTTYITLG